MSSDTYQHTDISIFGLYLFLFHFDLFFGHIYRVDGLSLHFTHINHSHKKRKDILEGHLIRVLFPTELEVPRLPQNTSNLNIENTGKRK